ncbi:MAG: polysaccharide deacetylase family protein [Bacteroidales bacterium]|nr:polysaccharide deacetylase family protein [Bacteroidales bacterium]
MKPFFYRFAKVLNWIPLELLIRVTGQRLVLPMYHLVSDNHVPHIINLYRAKTTREFERDLDELLKHYKPMGVADLLKHLKEETPVQKPSFLLSFDDGLREFHDVAAPILLKKGIPAVCFLNTGFVGNRDLFFRYKASILMDEIRKMPLERDLPAVYSRYLKQPVTADSVIHLLKTFSYANRQMIDELASHTGIDFREYLRVNEPYLTNGQIVALQRQGFVFGAHSVDHPLYTQLNLEQQLAQTEQSLDSVDTQFDAAYRLFSFPFTDDGVSSTFFSRVFDKQNRMADCTFGCAGLKNDSCRFNLQRIPFEAGKHTVECILKGEYIYYLCKALVNQNIIRRKAYGN